MIELNHPTGLATALDDTLFNPERREALAEAAAERVQAFAWPAIGEPYLEVYQSVAG